MGSVPVVDASAPVTAGAIPAASPYGAVGHWVVVVLSENTSEDICPLREFVGRRPTPEFSETNPEVALVLVAAVNRSGSFQIRAGLLTRFPRLLMGLVCVTRDAHCWSNCLYWFVRCRRGAHRI